MDFSSSQIKQVFRRFRRAPLFTAIAIFTLAAAIGANTAVFSVIEGVLLKPLPYPHTSQLVGVQINAPGVNFTNVGLGPSDYLVFRQQNRTFQDLGLYQGDSLSVTGVGQPEQVRALNVTEATLPILGVSPILGRAFTRADAAPDAPQTVILSYGYWESKFGGDPSVLGRTLVADGKPREIIGVLPENFHFLDFQNPALILPMQFDRNKTYLGEFGFQAIARLKPGVTIAQANADEARMLPIVLRSFPPPPGFSLDLFKKAQISADVRPLKQAVVGDVGKLLWVLMGSIGLVLLVACANVANLLLVRAEGRQQEMAIRTALGATRGRIAAEFLLESLALGLMGGVLGLALAWGALHLLVAMAPSGLPRLSDIHIDAVVLVFTLGISLFASLLFGSIPALKYAGARMVAGLREGSRTLGHSRERHRARSVLVAIQVALAFVLLVCAGLMIRTFHALTGMNPGYAEPGRIQTFRVSIPGTQVSKPEDVVSMEREMLRKLRAIPGVASAAFSVGIPMDGNHWNDPVFTGDGRYAAGALPPLRQFNFVSPGYFHAMGIPIIAGRDLTWTDTIDKLPVALVSANMARELWGSSAAALGKRIRISTKDDWREIIGVVGNVHSDGMSHRSPTIVYWPILVANFESDPIEVRRDVWSADPNLPLSSVHTAAYFYRRSLARTSFTLVMLAIAGAMGLLLGVVGLYGVIAYSVTQRTREIGIRVALGAGRRDLVAMFVRQGLLLAGIGITGGIFAALAVMRLMSSLLFHVSPADPLTYVAVALGLVAAAFLASYVPSRRANTVDPVTALRAE